MGKKKKQKQKTPGAQYFSVPCLVLGFCQLTTSFTTYPHMLKGLGVEQATF